MRNDWSGRVSAAFLFVSLGMAGLAAVALSWASGADSPLDMAFRTLVSLGAVALATLFFQEMARLRAGEGKASQEAKGLISAPVPRVEPTARPAAIRR